MERMLPAARGFHYGWITPAAAALVMLLAVLVLVGWVLDVPALRSPLPWLAPMRPLTAMGLIAAGLGLWLLRAEPEPGRRPWLGRALAVVAGLAGALTLLEYFTPTQVLRPSLAGGPTGPRPAVNSGVALVLTCAALLLLDTEVRHRRPAQWLAILIGVIALFTLVGIAYGANGWITPVGAPMAFNSALAFDALALGILFARGDRGFMRLVTGDDLGAALARRLVPAAILVPFILGWVRLAGQNAGLYGPELGVDLLVIAMIVTFGILIWISARAIRGLDLERRHAAMEIEQLYGREREARGEAERRATEEEALRAAVGSVVAAFTVQDITDEIAHSAVRATRADGAFVTRIDIERNEREVVAVAGERTLQVGNRIPYRGSLTAMVVSREEPLVVRDVSEPGPLDTRDLAEICRHCSAAFIPLLNAGEPLGALVLLRTPGRNVFRPDELARARTFGDLAALAFRKAHLLEDSERRRAELEQVMEGRARLIRGFSHDVKNPLGAADGLAALLEEGHFDPLTPRQAEQLRRVRLSIRASLDLIDDLLELGKAEGGMIEIVRGTADLREAAREIAGEYRAQAEAKGLRIELALPHEFPLIRSDASRIRQIIGNLVSNAVKYTNAGTITVRAEIREGAEDAPGPGPWATVSVQDTGPGIAADEVKLLFQEFARLAPRAGAGAGIGLAISQRIANALGGRITVRSQVGQGSTFTLWLPAEGTEAREQRPAA